MKPFIAAISLLLVSCNYTQTGETANCTVTLSGAATGTYDCRPATTIWMPSFNNVASFQFTVPQMDDKPGIEVSIGWLRRPAAGHYTSTDSDADGQVTVTMPLQPGERQPDIYNVRVGASTGGTSGDGSYDLALDRVDGPFPRYTGYAFDATGTLDASLSGGAVMVHVQF